MDKELLFAIYFSQIAGWQFHPGAGVYQHKKLSLSDCRDQAVEMMVLHGEFFSSYDSVLRDEVMSREASLRWED